MRVWNRVLLPVTERTNRPTEPGEVYPGNPTEQLDTGKPVTNCLVDEAPAVLRRMVPLECWANPVPAKACARQTPGQGVAA